MLVSYIPKFSDILSLSVKDHPSLWIHVDAAWAGIALCCPEYREKLYLPEINEIATSFCTNFHKVCHNSRWRAKYLIQPSGALLTLIALAFGFVIANCWQRLWKSLPCTYEQEKKTLVCLWYFHHQTVKELSSLKDLWLIIVIGICLSDVASVHWNSGSYSGAMEKRDLDHTSDVYVPLL